MTIVPITGISGAGKTTVCNELAKRGWKTVTNFTTRQPRSEEELDDYVFLTEEQFQLKLEHGDFIENVTYNGNRYAIGKYFPEGENVYMIVEPNGRNQILDLYNRGELGDNLKLKSFFIDLNEEVQIERLRKRGDSEEQIRERLGDDFDATPGCIILDGIEDADVLADKIERLCS